MQKVIRVRKRLPQQQFNPFKRTGDYFLTFDLWKDIASFTYYAQTVQSIWTFYVDSFSIDFFDSKQTSRT